MWRENHVHKWLHNVFTLLSRKIFKCKFMKSFVSASHHFVRYTCLRLESVLVADSMCVFCVVLCSAASPMQCLLTSVCMLIIVSKIMSDCLYLAVNALRLFAIVRVTLSVRKISLLWIYLKLKSSRLKVRKTVVKLLKVIWLRLVNLNSRSAIPFWYFLLVYDFASACL